MYFHKDFQKLSGYNYHISLWNCYREIDHHATLKISKNGTEETIHYGWKRSNHRIVWADNVNRNIPEQLKIIELYEKFEEDKKDLLSKDELSRLTSKFTILSSTAPR